jgi:hypothetical protein
MCWGGFHLNFFPYTFHIVDSILESEEHRGALVGGWEMKKRKERKGKK